MMNATSRDFNSAPMHNYVASSGKTPRQRFSRTRVRSFMFGDEAAGSDADNDKMKKTPELALMLAVLEDAIACFHGTLKAPRENPTVLRRQAHLWLNVTDWDSPFSFNNVCEALRLDPSAVREQIMKAVVVPARNRELELLAAAAA